MVVLVLPHVFELPLWMTAGENGGGKGGRGGGGKGGKREGEEKKEGGEERF
jgi:hypothetical protein